MRRFLNPSMVKTFLESAGNKIFTVTFEKKDGSVRVLNGRRGVHKNLKGGTPSPKKEGVITVFDLRVNDYRSVSLNRVIEARTCGTKLSVAN